MSRPESILSDLHEKVCLDFDEAWRGRRVPDLADFWRVGQPLALLAELVRIDMERQAKAGSSPRTAEYLRRFPALGTDRAVVLNLLQAEFGLRRRGETGLTPEALAGEYPDFAEDLGRRGVAGTVTALDTPGADEAEGMRPLPRVPEIPGFRILRVLGQGGMGIVYEAEEVTLRRRVALKVMRPEIAQDVAARRRFLREARTVARLNHDHVVAIHHVGEAAGRPFLTMPLLQGESLADRLARPPALTPGELAALGLQAARGLAAVHAAEMIHRDVKPGNLWLEKLPAAENDRTGEETAGAFGEPIAWRVKLLDFGLVRTGEDSRMSSTSLVVGTPAYIAPEQVQGSEVTCRADVFSLGCTLYEAATGRRPFAGSTIMAQIVELTHHRPPAPREINPDLPEALSTLIERMLARQPNDRPEAKQIVAVLQRLLRDAGTKAPPWTIPHSEPAPPGPSLQATVPISGSPRRRRWPVAGAIALLGLLGLLLAGVVLRFATPRGTLVLEIEDPEAEVLIQGQGVRLKTRERKLDLKVGDYTIELVEDGAGLKLNTDRFTIGAKGKEVRVWVERKARRATPVEPARAVERILRQGGQVTCEVAGKGSFVVAEPNRIPREPFTPVAVHLRAGSPAAAQEASEALLALDGCGFLRLEGDAVDDAILERLAAMPSLARLRELDLTGTKITPAGYLHLPLFKELTKFTHFHAKLDQPALKCLGKLPALMFLNLHGCSIPDEAIAGLRGLPLGYLNLAANPRLTNAGLRHLSPLRTLTSLNLSRARIDDAGLEALGHLTGLKELSLNETNVTAKGLRFLRPLGVLRSLKLQEIPGIDDQALPDLSAMRSLTHLYLRGTRVTPEGVRRLKAALPPCTIDIDQAPATR